ncbi:amidohydrolase family protein [Nonomuraea spiralis]|uniref:amidohydrolase family protein n=1 Tax=Nonomuraea spiralis TaxID=46182 RepID=UPI00378DB403
MRSPSRIDAHHHVWELARRPHRWLEDPALAPVRADFTPAAYAVEAAAAGVSGAVLVQVLHDPAETREFLAVAAAWPLVAGVVGWADLAAPDLAGELDALAAAPGGGRLAGLRHLAFADPDPRWLGRDDVRRGLALLGRRGLAYDLVIGPHQLPLAAATARALPGVAFVLDHLGNPPVGNGDPRPWADGLRELARLPNVTCKLSGLARPGRDAALLRPYAEVALDAFGPDRLMYGSDWPLCLLGGSYAAWAGTVDALIATLSPDERAAVLHRTATAVYHLT